MPALVDSANRRATRVVRGAPVAVDRSPATASFAINGRFLSQPVTGVQRYGLEIVRAIDRLATERGLVIELCLPPGAQPPSCLGAISTRASRWFGGHAWEQSLLAGRGQRLLNLCNTAPLLGTNGVLCIHDANVFDVPHCYKPVFRRFYTFLHRQIARSSARIATVSHYAANRLALHLQVEASAIVVAPNGYEHALGWSPDRASVRLGERPYVLMIGSLAPHKNIGRILDIAAELDRRGLDVLIAGSAGAIFSNDALRRCSNVRYLGRITDDDLAFLLERAVLLAFPSLSEGFGLPVLEAMVWGCPVVANRASSVPEVGGDAILYADADEGSAWLAQIDRLLAATSLRDELRERGRLRAKRFSWQQAAATYLDLMA